MLDKIDHNYITEEEADAAWDSLMGMTWELSDNMVFFMHPRTFRKINKKQRLIWLCLTRSHLIKASTDTFYKRNHGKNR